MKERIVSHGISRCVCPFAAFLVLVGLVVVGRAAEPRKTENVIFVMTDGLRWQEVFGGADSSLVNDSSYVKKDRLANVNEKFVRATPEAGREAVMPFLWGVVAKQGQIYGNQNKQSKVQVTNGLKFSYPGYQETLCGFPDTRINKNDFGPNPNVTVLEWLHRKPAFAGRVAAFTMWGAFNDILNRQRCGFCVNAGFDPFTEFSNPELTLLNQIKAEAPRCWADPFDVLTFHTAFEYFKAKHPRVFYLSLGETDEWGHLAQYDQYLAAARRADDYVWTLWETAQAMPEYRGKTSLIFSTDHGRGLGRRWTDHGKDVEGAENTWVAFLGPDTPPLGERSGVSAVAQNQIAATLASLLSEDYATDAPKAGKPIAEVVKQ